MRRCCGFVYFVPMSRTVPRHPGASSPVITARMSVLARRDTAPEMALRRALHAAGHRFRVVYPVPDNRRRSIDIAFTKAKVAVFVDGCFWHGCPEHGTQPRTNSDWWTTKLAANMARDTDTDQLLRQAGWCVLRIWEHEDVSAALAMVQGALDEALRGDPEGLS